MVANWNGWPKDLVNTQDEDFLTQATNWLLDRLPGEFRGSAIRSDPLALAWVLQGVIEGQIDVFRRLYGTARGQATTSNMNYLLESLSAAGAMLVKTQREVNLVAAALESNSGVTTDTRLE